MLKMKSTLETEVYIGGNGHLVIKQICYPDDDCIVSLSHEQALLVADYIKTNIDELKSAWNNSKDESYEQQQHL